MGSLGIELQIERQQHLLEDAGRRETGEREPRSAAERVEDQVDVVEQEGDSCVELVAGEQRQKACRSPSTVPPAAGIGSLHADVMSAKMSDVRLPTWTSSRKKSIVFRASTLHEPTCDRVAVGQRVSVERHVEIVELDTECGRRGRGGGERREKSGHTEGEKRTSHGMYPRPFVLDGARSSRSTGRIANGRGGGATRPPERPRELG